MTFKDKNGAELKVGSRVRLEGYIEAFYRNEEEGRNVHIMIQDENGEYIVRVRPESLEKV